jgi:hypothetical protein
LIDPEIIKVLDPYKIENEEKKIILQYNIEYPADRELDFYKNENASIDSTL